MTRGLRPGADLHVLDAAKPHHDWQGEQRAGFIHPRRRLLGWYSAAVVFGGTFVDSLHGFARALSLIWLQPSVQDESGEPGGTEGRRDSCKGSAVGGPEPWVLRLAAEVAQVCLSRGVGAGSACLI